MDHTTFTPTEDVNFNELYPGLNCRITNYDDEDAIYTSIQIPREVFDYTRFQTFKSNNLEYNHYFTKEFFEAIHRGFEKFEDAIGRYIKHYSEDKGNHISKVFIVNPADGSIRGSFIIQREDLDSLPTYGIMTRGDTSFYLPFIKSKALDIGMLNHKHPMGLQLPTKDGSEKYITPNKVEYKDFLGTTVHIIDEPEENNPFKMLILSGAALDKVIEEELKVNNESLDKYYEFVETLHDVVSRLVHFGFRWTYRRQGHRPIFKIPMTDEHNFTLGMHRQDERILQACMRKIIQPSIDEVETKKRIDDEVIRLLQYPRYVEGNDHVLPLIEYIDGSYCQWEIMNQKGFFIPQSDI